MANEYFTDLGKIVANLHSLELLLRAFLYDLDHPSKRLTYGVDFYGHPVGTGLPENAITNYDTLGGLIDKFNKVVRAQKLGPELDRSLITIRDALAHGRISMAKDGDVPRLIKFGKAKGGKVFIEVNETLTGQWLRDRRREIHASISLVVAALNEMRKRKRNGASV